MAETVYEYNMQVNKGHKERYILINEEKLKFLKRIKAACFRGVLLEG